MPASFSMRWSRPLHERRPAHRGGLMHHSDRGSQYVSIKYTERLAEAGIEPSVGSVGDSYDNASPRRSTASTRPRSFIGVDLGGHFEAVEFATLRMGRLVQQSPAAGAHRQHPAGRSRGNATTPCWTKPHGGVTQTKQPPANPGRFIEDDRRQCQAMPSEHMEEQARDGRILITGATGYFGRVLLERTIESSHATQITATYRREAPQSFIGARVSLVEYDELIRGNFDLRSIDFICHLAAARIAGTEAQMSKSITDVRVLLERASEANLQGVIFASSQAVYGVASPMWRDNAPGARDPLRLVKACQ